MSNRVIASTAAISTATVLPSFLLGAMAVQVSQDLGFAEAGIGAGFAVFFLTASLASAPGGRLADRRDPVVVTRVAATVSGATSLIAAGFATSLPLVLACLAVAGAANAVCQTATSLMIVRVVPVSRQGFALAVKQSAIPGAALLAGLAVPGFALTFGWRWAYVTAAGLAFATSVWVPRRPHHQRYQQRRSHPHPAEEPETIRTPRSDLPIRVMVVLAAAIALAATAAGSLGSFLVSAAVDANIPEATAGLLLTGSSIAGIIVRMLAGVDADRRGRGHFRGVTLMIGAGVIAFALLAVHVPAAYLVAGPLAFCTAWAWPGLFNLAVVRANPSNPATANGITQTGQFTGGVIGPVLFGIIAQHAGYQAAWLTASVLAATATIAMTIMYPRIREVVSRPRCK